MENHISIALEIVREYSEKGGLEGGLEKIIGKSASLEEQIERVTKYNQYAENVVNRHIEYKKEPIYKRAFNFITRNKKVKRLKQEYANVLETTNRTIVSLAHARRFFKKLNEDYSKVKETIEAYECNGDHETINFLKEKGKDMENDRNKLGVYLAALEYRFALFDFRGYYSPNCIDPKIRFNPVCSASY